MSVNAVSGSTTNTSATGTLDKMAFLRLFTTQLKNQDPLNPMDSAQFTAQLAQFSAVEQLFNINSQLTKLGDLQGALLQGMTAGLIGKTVTLTDGTTGKVNAVVMENNQVQVLLSDNRQISMNQIKKISA
jgi:flagellar basal-body rod modification protein FlgD